MDGLLYLPGLHVQLPIVPLLVLRDARLLRPLWLTGYIPLVLVARLVRLWLLVIPVQQRAVLRRGRRDERDNRHMRRGRGGRRHMLRLGNGDVGPWLPVISVQRRATLRRGRRDEGDDRHTRRGSGGYRHMLRLGNGDGEAQTSLHAIFLNVSTYVCKDNAFNGQEETDSGGRRGKKDMKKTTAGAKRSLVDPPKTAGTVQFI